MFAKHLLLTQSCNIDSECGIADCRGWVVAFVARKYTVKSSLWVLVSGTISARRSHLAWPLLYLGPFFSSSWILKRMNTHYGEKIDSVVCGEAWRWVTTWQIRCLNWSESAFRAWFQSRYGSGPEAFGGSCDRFVDILFFSASFTVVYVAFTDSSYLFFPNSACRNSGSSTGYLFSSV